VLEYILLRMHVWFYCVCFHFSVPSQEIGWEESLRNDLFCVGWDVNIVLQLYTPWSIKMCHYIFDNNFIIHGGFVHFVTVEKWMNTPQNSCKHYSFSLSVSSIATLLLVVWDNRGWLQCVQLNWWCVTFTESRPMFVFSIFVKGIPWWFFRQKIF